MGLEPTRVSAKVFETSLSTIPTLRHIIKSPVLTITLTTGIAGTDPVLDS